MDMDFDTPKKRNVLTLQLAPMIDVFVLIIVFLLKATVLSGVSITWPGDLKTAKSSSKEGVETASQIVVSKDMVDLKMIHKKIPLVDFTSSSADLNLIRPELNDYLDALKNQSESGLMNINLVADKWL